jgi:OFA family oxalate/formate antiporter-like MFS transporter
MWAPIAVGLIGRLGLVWTLRMLGGAFVVITVTCSLFIKTAPVGYTPLGWTPPQPRDRLSKGGVDKDWKGMLGTPVFWVLALLFAIGTTSGMMVIGHASPIAQDILRLSPAAAGAVVSYVAVGMAAGKLGWGALSDRIGRIPVLMAMLVVAAAGLVTVWRTDSYAPVVIGMGAVGLCYGGCLALMGPVTAEAFGSKHLGINYGIMFLTVAIAAFVGPRIAAAVSQANDGHYSWAFVIAAIITALGIVLVAAYAFLARRRATATR